MNTAQFFGRLTQQPEVRYTPSGTAIGLCGLAVNDNYKNKAGEWQERTHFFDLKLWGKTAERVAEKFHKGQMVYVECKPVLDQWEKEGQKHKKVVFEVRYIDDIERYGRRAASQPQPERNDYQKPNSSSGWDDDTPDFDEDDIPF